MRIVRMQFEQLDAALALGQRMHAESSYSFLPFSLAKARRFLKDAISNSATSCALVAQQDDEVIGMLVGSLEEYLFCYSKAAVDHVLYVDSAHRRSGAGAMLIRAFQSWARAQGAQELCLGVSAEIAKACPDRLYVQHGFRRVGAIYKQRITAGDSDADLHESESREEEP